MATQDSSTSNGKRQGSNDDEVDQAEKSRAKRRNCFCGDIDCMKLLYIALEYFSALSEVVFDGKKYPIGDLQWIQNKTPPGMYHFKSGQAAVQQLYVDEMKRLKLVDARLNDGSDSVLSLMHFEWNMVHTTKASVLSNFRLCAIKQKCPGVVARSFPPSTGNENNSKHLVVPSHGIAGMLKSLSRFGLHGMKQASLQVLCELARQHCPDDRELLQVFESTPVTIVVQVCIPINALLRSGDKFRHRLESINRTAAAAADTAVYFAAQVLHVETVLLVREFLSLGDRSGQMAALKHCFTYLADDRTAISHSIDNNSHAVYEALREVDVTKFWDYKKDNESDMYHSVNQTRQLQRISPPNDIDRVFQVLGQVLKTMEEDFKALVKPYNSDGESTDLVGATIINAERYLIKIPTNPNESGVFRGYNMVVEEVQAVLVGQGYTKESISHIIARFCKAQCIPTLLYRMSPEQRQSLKYLHFHQFSFLVSYNDCGAQCPHIDIPAPNAQGTVMLSSCDDGEDGSSAPTMEYRMKNPSVRIGNLNELDAYGNTLWRKLSLRLRAVLARNGTFQRYLAKFGKVMVNEEFYEMVEETLPRSEVGTTSLLGGDIVHAGPMSEMYRALIFFAVAAIFDGQEPMLYNGDVQYNKVALTVTEVILILTDIFDDPDHDIGNDDKEILLMLVAKAVQDLDSPHSCDLLEEGALLRKFAMHVNIIVFAAKDKRKVKKQEPAAYIECQVKKLVEKYMKKPIRLWKN